MLFGFAPWLVYWVLVGNVPFKTAVVVALAIAVAAFVIGRLLGKSGGTLEIGAVATFALSAKCSTRPGSSTISIPTPIASC